MPQERVNDDDPKDDFYESQIARRFRRRSFFGNGSSGNGSIFLLFVLFWFHFLFLFFFPLHLTVLLQRPVDSRRELPPPDQMQSGEERRQVRAEQDGESLGEIPVERMRSVKVGDAANHVEFQEFPGDEGEAAVAERVEGAGGDDGDDADGDRAEEEAPAIRSGDLFGE